MSHHFYDPATFEYAGSMASSGNFGALPPDNSTPTAPNPSDGCAAFWDVPAGKWHYAEDHRGEHAYAKDLSGSVLITAVGTVSDDYTLTPPPELRKGFVVEWQDTGWGYVEDHRGAVGYVDGEQMTVTELGPLPEGFGTEAPKPPPYVPPPDTRTAEEKRAAAYCREADPIVQQIDGYEREAEALREVGEEEKALAADAKGRERLLAFLAKKDEIRARYPDE